jgi:ACS family hexuronate transporter-like MFS transporter
MELFPKRAATMTRLDDRSYHSSSYRWIILSLIFLLTTNNYLIRTALGVVSTAVRSDLKLDEVHYGYVLTAFSITYAAGFLFAGRLVDWLGVRMGLFISTLAWSIFGTAVGSSGTLISLIGWRGLLGVAQSAHFPAAIKSVSEWFAPRQRALATSLFNSGPHIALVLGPPVIAWITRHYGWRTMYTIVGLSGIPLAILWWLLARNPRKDSTNVSAPSSNPIEPSYLQFPVGEILRSRAAWGIMIGKFCADPVWWFYIFWLPSYLNKRYGLNLEQIGYAFPIIYALAIVMANVAGWYAGQLIDRGRTKFDARKHVMMICAMCMPITALAGISPSPWIVILLVSLAAGAHSGWSANIFTLCSDSFPSQAVGTVAGLAGFAGGVGGIVLSSLAPGYIIKYFGYVPIFVLMGLLHPLALCVIHWTIRPQSASSTSSVE